MAKEESTRGDISSSSIGHMIKKNSLFSSSNQCAVKTRLTLCFDLISLYIRTALQKLQNQLTCLHEMSFFFEKF